jgi:septal ring factor EnvC (AmiA/AmiB activator)
MGRLGYLQTLASADSGESFLRGLQLLSFLAGRDARLLRAYEGSLADLAVKEKNLATLRASIATVAAEARVAERALARARAEKATLLARLERSAEEQRTNLAALEDKTSRLAALLELLETRGRSLPAGSASIRRYKGAIDWPVRGKVVVPFGRIANPRFPKTFLRSSGWTIDVPTGTPVRAVFAGDVVYAQWLKGYGNLVVLDHGDGVFTLYGHLMTGTAPRGTRVALGEAVGRVADPPEEEVPGVYFEIRESRTSVDPRGWLR